MAVVVTFRHLSGSLAGKSQRVAFDEGQVLRLGRAEDSDLRFGEHSDDQVSGQHAEIWLQDGRLLVKDQGSTNGTFLGGVRCLPRQPIPVADGARLRLGQEGPEMELSLQGAAAPGKEAVGKSTLLREIGKARGEERSLVQQELRRGEKKETRRLGAGLAALLLLGALAIGGTLWWSGRKTIESAAKLAQEQQLALEKERNIWPEVERRVHPAVVQVVCNYRLRSLRSLGAGTQLARRREFTGSITASGVLIRPGLILTALHAVEPWKFNLDWVQVAKEFKPEYDSLEVQFPGYQPLHATVDVSSTEFDLALLRIPQTNATPVEMGRTNADVRVTQRIAVFGYPGALGLYELKVTNASERGSGLRPRPELTPTFVYGAVAQPLSGPGTNSHFLYFDASLSPGVNGGPVVDDQGRLIGIVTTRFDRPGTIFELFGYKIRTRLPLEPSNFAVSPDDLHSFLRMHGLL